MREAFEALLDVQAHDTRLDQLRHRLTTLPARTERDDARTALDTLVRDLAALQADRDDLGRRQRRLEDEVETIEAKRKGHNDRLYGGTVTNARELQDLQEEIEALGRRVHQLEDQDLELMEQIEPLDEQLADLTGRRDQATTHLAGTEEQLIAAEAELAVELDEAQAARDGATAAIPADLLAQYQSLRAGLGGVGIARLVGNQCGGCHLTLSAVEVAGMRKRPDEVTHCEECGRLLVP